MCDTIPDIPTLAYLECIFERLVGSLLAFLGIGFFVMFIIGGFKYITSAGDPKAIESASKTLSYATIGLIASAVGYLILVIIESVTGAKVTEFAVFKI